MHQPVVNPYNQTPKWRQCHTCDVGWRGHESCWLCGAPGVVEPLALIPQCNTFPDSALGVSPWSADSSASVA